MMELAHEEDKSCSYLELNRSFNPCYDGIGSRREGGRLNMKGRTGFNPCYDGIGSRSLMVYALTALKIEFQSLLWWNWLTKNIKASHHPNRGEVSILVMMELAHEVIINREQLWGLPVSILVMMELAHEDFCRFPEKLIILVSILVMMELAHEVFLYLMLAIPKPCFNPCYDGIGSRRRFLPGLIFPNHWFQSLLWWNWLTKLSALSGTYSTARFQSLLWWNWLTKGKWKQ